MPGIDVSIQVDQFFTGLWDDVNTWAMAGLGAAALLLADRIRDTFDAKGERGGHPKWLITRNPTPLIKTGRLYRSFEGRVVRSQDGFEVTVATDVPYALKHNDGLEGMPKREFMFFTDDDLDLVERILSEKPI